MAAQDLCARTDVRLALELPAGETSRDALIDALITQASDSLLDEARREFAPAVASATRRLNVYPGRRLDGAYFLDLAPYDLRTVTSATLHPETSSPETLVVTEDYLLEASPPAPGVYSALRIGRHVGLSSTVQSTFGFAYLDIAGAWGFASVPENVKRAAVVAVTTWLRRDIPALNIEAFEEGRGLLPGSLPILDLPYASRRLVAPFSRKRVFA